jgi:hypothetical protein
VDSDSDRDRRIQALFAFSAPVWTLLCGTGMFYVLPALIARIGGEEGGREFKINEIQLGPCLAEARLSRTTRRTVQHPPSQSGQSVCLPDHRGIDVRTGRRLVFEHSALVVCVFPAPVSAPDPGKGTVTD